MMDGYGRVARLLNTVVELCIVWLLLIPSLVLCHRIVGTVAIEQPVSRMSTLKRITCLSQRYQPVHTFHEIPIPQHTIVYLHGYVADRQQEIPYI